MTEILKRGKRGEIKRKERKRDGSITAHFVISVGLATFEARNRRRVTRSGALFFSLPISFRGLTRGMKRDPCGDIEGHEPDSRSTSRVDAFRSKEAESNGASPRFGNLGRCSPTVDRSQARYNEARRLATAGARFRVERA